MQPKTQNLKTAAKFRIIIYLPKAQKFHLPTKVHFLFLLDFFLKIEDFVDSK